MQLGVSETVAAELVRDYSAADIETQIEAVNWLRSRNDKRVSQNPAGFLVQAIRESYVTQRLEGKEAEQKRVPGGSGGRERPVSSKAVLPLTARRAAGDGISRDTAQEPGEQNRDKGAEAIVREDGGFLAFWELLSREKQVVFEAEAIGRTSHTKRDGYLRAQNENSPLFEQYRLMILREHFQSTLDAAGTRSPEASIQRCPVTAAS